jgi:hypothetical protein
MLSSAHKGLFLKTWPKAIVDLKFAVRALNIGGSLSLSVKYKIFGMVGYFYLNKFQSLNFLILTLKALISGLN